MSSNSVETSEIFHPSAFGTRNFCRCNDSDKIGPEAHKRTVFPRRSHNQRLQSTDSLPLKLQPMRVQESCTRSKYTDLSTKLSVLRCAPTQRCLKISTTTPVPHRSVYFSSSAARCALECHCLVIQNAKVACHNLVLQQRMGGNVNPLAFVGDNNDSSCTTPRNDTFPP